MSHGLVEEHDCQPCDPTKKLTGRANDDQPATSECSAKIGRHHSSTRLVRPDYVHHFTATIISHSTRMRILEEDHRSRRLQLPLMTRSRRSSQSQRARQRNRPRSANLETVIPCAACARRNPRTQTLQQREPFWRGFAGFRGERLQFLEVVDWFSSCYNR